MEMATTQTTIKPSTQPWFEIDGEHYRGEEPNFYRPEDFPWIKNLEDNWRVIRDEIEALLARKEDRLKPYFVALSFPPKQWKTMGFYFWKYRIHRNCRACPRTAEILESLPNMTAGSLSVLEA
jgi:aspartyl/asparaginyl beta-hydroxylase (cupin superfamily)